MIMVGQLYYTMNLNGKKVPRKVQAFIDSEGIASMESDGLLILSIPKDLKVDVPAGFKHTPYYMIR